MTTNTHTVSAVRLNRLKAQGYFDYSDTKLSTLAFGIRFAYILCFSILAIGVTTANIPTLVVMMLVAFFGIILPYHPFDYIYNHVLRGILNKPKLPPRSIQLKFACGIATIWLGAIVYSFSAGHMIAGYVNGGLLASVAFTVGTSDFCVPSTIFNTIFKIEV